MTKKLVLGYSPYSGGENIFPFGEIFDMGQDTRKHGFDGIDAFVLWGGTDIHPSYYNKYPHISNQAGTVPSQRDEFEWRAILTCRMKNIPIIGVCRGAQMLCAAAGGRLVQHTSGHGNGHHPIVTKDGEIFPTTSCHHQMMYPFDIEHEMLAWSKIRLSDRYEDEEQGKNMPEMADKVEPECVYFPRIRGLGIQGHPEWMSQSSRLVEWFNHLIITKLLLCVPEEENAAS